MKKGTYRFNVYHYGQLFKHMAQVTILDETANSYKIRIPFAIGGHAPNDTMWVLKKSVRLESEPDAQRNEIDYSNAYWNR